MSAASLAVYLDRSLVGNLRLDPQRRFVFQYEESWLRSAHPLPISLMLPLRESPYLNDEARAFFANLLPESQIRQAIAAIFGTSERNDYKLLEAIGGECAGAISVWPESQLPDLEDERYRRITGKELDALIQNMSRRPLLLGGEGARLSLAGAQAKITLLEQGEAHYLPLGFAASSHIIKPAIPDFEGTVQNEVYCMRLASALGMNVSEASILQTPTQPLYKVKRYDRAAVSGRRTPARIHQEDFCQALGVLPDSKYESEGGPTLQNCFERLTEVSDHAALDRKELLRWVIFNFLIGNMDAHAKNISLLIHSRGSVRLAPFYDLMSTWVYPGLTRNLAMKIGGEGRPDWIQARHWERFARSIEITPKYFFETAMKMAEVLPEAARITLQEMETHGWGHPILLEIASLAQKRSKKLLSQLRARPRAGKTKSS